MAKPEAVTVEQKLDVIIEHLHHLDRRDRLRTIGSTVRGLLSLIPLLFLLWSAWYVYKQGDKLLETITRQAATAAAEATKNSSKGMLDDLLERYNVPKE